MDVADFYGPSTESIVSYTNEGFESMMTGAGTIISSTES
jgi:hypothetical protein